MSGLAKQVSLSSLFNDKWCDFSVASRQHLFRNRCNIFHSDYIHHSLFPSKSAVSSSTCFSFTRFADLSPAETAFTFWAVCRLTSLALRLSCMLILVQALLRLTRLLSIL